MLPFLCLKSTQLYEYVLINENGEQAFTQVEQGDIDIDAKLYENLDGKVFLFTTEGKLENLENVSENKIKKVSPEDIYKFLLDENNKKFLSENIINRLKFWEKIKNPIKE